MANLGAQASEQDQARFFTQLSEKFAAATERTGEIIRDFRIAGTPVRLRFAGDAMIPEIAPGLAGFVPEGLPEPHCEIRIWDSESSGIEPPPSPRPWKDFTGRGNIWGFDSARYLSAYQWGEGSVSVMDRETRQAVYWAPSHKHLPEWVLSSPLRTILHWWMEMNGRQLVHAAGVGHDGCGILLPGRGGSGKSSTSLACLLAGMDFLGDDYLAVALNPEPRAYRLYSTAKLDRESLGLYPELRARCPTVLRPNFAKAVLYLEDAYGGALKESLPLKLVLRPSIAAQNETVLTPIEAREIESAFSFETLLHLPHAGAHTMEFLDRIAREIPRAAILLGSDRARIPVVLQESLGNIAADFRRHEIADPRPAISVLVHFREEERGELATLAAMLQSQDYPRAELIVTVEPAARALADLVAKLPGNVKFFPFDDPIVKAEAWNRAIRESFAERLLVIEPGDRLEPGAIQTLCEGLADSGAAYIVPSGAESLQPPRGAMMQKSAFRQCGLFRTDPLHQGREQQEWFQRLERAGLRGSRIAAVTLRATRTPEAIPVPHPVDWKALREQLQRRGKTSE